MPPKFGMIAALQGNFDTSDGVGKVYFREDSSPGVLLRAAEHINRAFPEDQEVTPIHAVVVTWVDVANHETRARGPDIDKKVSVLLLFKSICGAELVIYILSNVFYFRETPSSWLLHPWRLPLMLLFYMQKMAYSFPPRPRKTVIESCMLVSVRVSVSGLSVTERTTASLLMTRHPSEI